jgi:menaquinone-9 beta-reductase
MTQPCCTHEVVVVGAGPAGVAAAITLARLGIKPLVLEKAAGPRVKHCGGAVSPSGVKQYMRLGLPQDYFRQHGFPTDEGWISGFGVVLHGRTPGRRLGYFVERRHIDWTFQQTAITEQGIHIEYGAEVVGLRCDAHELELEVRQDGRVDVYCPRFLIAADGAASLIRRSISGRCIHSRSLVLTSSATLAEGSDRPAILFHEDHMPSYSWVFPNAGNRTNIGIGIYASGYRKLENRSAMEALIAQMTELDYEGKLSRWIINTNAIQRRTYGSRVFLVGDAGAFADALTGEGISFALRSGVAAARTVALVRRFGSVFAWSYCICMLPITVRLLAAKLLQMLISRYPALAGWFLRLCSRNKVARWMIFRYFSNA